MASIWKTYSRLLYKYPFSVGAITTGVLSAGGDAIAQTVIEQKRDKFDIYRTSRFFSFGFFILGPSLRGWYFLLERLYPGARSKTVLLKIITDQSCFPPVIISTFLLYMSCARGETIPETKARYKRDFPGILASNYKFWPFVQTVNFFIIPLYHRVLFSNCASLVWNTYLAWRSERY